MSNQFVPGPIIIYECGCKADFMRFMGMCDYHRHAWLLQHDPETFKGEAQQAEVEYYRSRQPRHRIAPA